MFDEIYEEALKHGATGGKLSGAGGGGFFTFYCSNDHQNLRDKMHELGLIELRYDFDYEGTKVLANFSSYQSEKKYHYKKNR